MSGAPVDGRGTYVLDTSVLLSDPMAFSRFGRHDVIIPVVGPQPVRRQDSMQARRQ